MANFSPLTAEIGWGGVWGTPANFNGFHDLASLLHRRRSTLHDVWPSPGLVHCIYIFGAAAPMEFCQVQNSFCFQVFCSPILAALLHNTRAVGIRQTLQRGTRNDITELLLLVIFNRGRHLYSEGGHYVGHRPTF